MKKRMLKILLVAVGSLLMLNAAVMVVTSNLNFGIIAELILGAVLTAYGIFIDKFIASRKRVFTVS